MSPIYVSYMFVQIFSTDCLLLQEKRLFAITRTPNYMLIETNVAQMVVTLFAADLCKNRMKMFIRYKDLSIHNLILSIM